MGIKVHAQLDPTLTGMALDIHRKGKENLEEPGKSHATQTTGHIWTKEEVKASPTCKGSSTTIWIRSVRLSAMPPRYTASTTR